MEIREDWGTRASEGFSLHGVSRLFYRSASHLVDNDWNNNRSVLGFASHNSISDDGIFILRAVVTFFLISNVGQVANNKLCAVSCRRSVSHVGAVFILLNRSAVF